MTEADYAIVGVRFEEENDTRILEVKIREDKGTAISSHEETWSRQEVIEQIKNGKIFVTYTKNDGGWGEGEEVHTVEINGNVWIRTDRNDEEEDNLGELPEF